VVPVVFMATVLAADLPARSPTLVGHQAVNRDSEPNPSLLRREANQELTPGSFFESDGQDTDQFYGGTGDAWDAMPEPAFPDGSDERSLLAQRGRSWVQTSGPSGWGPPERGEPGPPGRRGKNTRGPRGPPGPPGYTPGQFTLELKKPRVSRTGHWRYDPRTPHTEVFQTDFGGAQGIHDGGRVRPYWGKADPELTQKLEEMEGPTSEITGSGIEATTEILAAEENGGHWLYGPDGEDPKFLKSVPQKKGFQKFYHDQWVSPMSHGKSAYQPDPFHDHSENFGPFIIDYDGHNVKLPDWTLVVKSTNDHPGHGNVGVGLDNYFYDASNSFVAGRHNIIKGENNAVLGGEDNAAAGNAAIVTGGQKNIASGEAASVVGGYKNEAFGQSSSVMGGKKNMARGKFSGVTGGIHNIAEGDFSLVGGGQGNKAEARDSVVGGGGFDNKAVADGSIVAGGQGGEAEKHYVVTEGSIPKAPETDPNAIQ